MVVLCSVPLIAMLTVSPGAGYKGPAALSLPLRVTLAVPWQIDWLALRLENAAAGREEPFDTVTIPDPLK